MSVKIFIWLYLIDKTTYFFQCKAPTYSKTNQLHAPFIVIGSFYSFHFLLQHLFQDSVVFFGIDFLQSGTDVFVRQAFHTEHLCNLHPPPLIETVLVAHIKPAKTSRIQVALLLQMIHNPFCHFLRSPPLANFLLHVRRATLHRRAIHFGLTLYLCFTIFFHGLIAFIIRSFPDKSFRNSIWRYPSSSSIRTVSAP